MNTLNTFSWFSKCRYICPQLVLLVSCGAFSFLPLVFVRTYIESKAELLIGQREHILQLEVLHAVLQEFTTRTQNLVVVKVKKKWEGLLVREGSTQRLGHVVALSFHTCPGFQKQVWVALDQSFQVGTWHVLRVLLNQLNLSSDEVFTILQDKFRVGVNYFNNIRGLDTIVSFKQIE